MKNVIAIIETSAPIAMAGMGTAVVIISLFVEMSDSKFNSVMTFAGGLTVAAAGIYQTKKQSSKDSLPHS